MIAATVSASSTGARDALSLQQWPPLPPPSSAQTQLPLTPAPARRTRLCPQTTPPQTMVPSCVWVWSAWTLSTCVSATPVRTRTCGPVDGSCSREATPATRPRCCLCWAGPATSWLPSASAWRQSELLTAGSGN